MNTKDFAVAVNKFFFYSMNYPSVEITYPTLFNGEQKKYLPSFFEAFDKSMLEHYVPKWLVACERRGSYGAINDFYGELDGENRAKMLKYINETYKMNEDFGISLKELN